MIFDNANHRRKVASDPTGRKSQVTLPKHVGFIGGAPYYQTTIHVSDEQQVTSTYTAACMDPRRRQ
jgi:hypothetical protein